MLLLRAYGYYPWWVITLVYKRELLLAMLTGMTRQATIVNGRLVARRWARHPRCIRLARAELSKVLADWGLAAGEDAALVVLSELLTNAVVHAHVSPGREIETCFRHEADGRLRIAVDDADDRRPHLRAPGLDGGRGLPLVAALSDSWGVSPRPQNGVGKSVWAVLTVPGEG